MMTVWQVIQFVLGAISFVVFWTTIILWVRCGCRFPRFINWIALASLAIGPLMLWLVSSQGYPSVGWIMLLLVLPPVTVYGGAIILGVLSFGPDDNDGL